MSNGRTAKCPTRHPRARLAAARRAPPVRGEGVAHLPTARRSSVEPPLRPVGADARPAEEEARRADLLAPQRPEPRAPAQPGQAPAAAGARPRRRRAGAGAGVPPPLRVGDCGQPGARRLHPRRRAARRRPPLRLPELEPPAPAPRRRRALLPLPAPAGGRRARRRRRRARRRVPAPRLPRLQQRRPCALAAGRPSCWRSGRRSAARRCTPPRRSGTWRRPSA